MHPKMHAIVQADCTQTETQTSDKLRNNTGEPERARAKSSELERALNHNLEARMKVASLKCNNFETQQPEATQLEVRQHKSQCLGAQQLCSQERHRESLSELDRTPARYFEFKRIRATTSELKGPHLNSIELSLCEILSSKKQRTSI